MPTSVGAATSSHVAQALSQPEATEKKSATGRDTKIDGDGDNAGGSNTVKPTVNTQGQQLGQVLNTKA